MYVYACVCLCVCVHPSTVHSFEPIGMNPSEDIGSDIWNRQGCSIIVLGDRDIDPPTQMYGDANIEQAAFNYRKLN